METTDVERRSTDPSQLPVVGVVGGGVDIAALFDDIHAQDRRSGSAPVIDGCRFERYEVGRTGLTGRRCWPGDLEPRGLGSAAAVVVVLDSGTFRFLGRDSQPPEERDGPSPADLLNLAADELGPDAATRPVAVVLTRTEAISTAVPYDYHFELAPAASPDARRTHARRVDAELRWVVSNWVDDDQLIAAIARFGRVTLHPSASPPTLEEFLAIVGAVLDRRGQRSG